MSEVYTKDDAALEGEQNVLIEELAGIEGDLSAEDLRRLGGSDAEGLSDDELVQLWNQYQKDGSAPSSGAAGASGQAPGGSTSAGANVSTQGGTANTRSWKFYDGAGNAVESVEALTLKDFLSGKIGYNALGKEQQRSLDELVRVAQFGHLNETKLGMQRGEYDAARKELATLRNELGTSKQERAAVDRAFQQFHMGNEQPLRQLLEKHKAGLAAEPSAPATAGSDAEYERIGQQYYQTTLQPIAHQIADRYGVQRSDVERALQTRLANDPNITEDKLALWLNHEIPLEIEAAGYALRATAGTVTATTSSGATAGSSDRVAELERRLAEAEAKLQNGTTQDVRSRRSNTPGAPGQRGNTSTQPSDVIPADALKSQDAFKRYLRDM